MIDQMHMMSKVKSTEAFLALIISTFEAFGILPCLKKTFVFYLTLCRKRHEKSLIYSLPVKVTFKVRNSIISFFASLLNEG